jgi:stress response protein YsnF
VAIPIAHEEARVLKRVVETGRVRVRTSVEETPTWVREELAREDVQVEWIDIGREVDEVPAVRTEGDTLIVPIFEEVLVIEKRLVLRQEIRLTRRMVTEPFEEEVALRRTRADVERTAPAHSPHLPKEPS